MSRFFRFSSKLLFPLTFVCISIHAYAGPPTVADDSSDKKKPDISIDAQTGKNNAKTQPKEEITFLLSGYEYFPKRADLDKIAPAPQVETILMDIVREGKSDLEKIRAVAALGFYDSPEVLDFLNKLAHRQSIPSPHGATLNLSPRLADSLQHRSIVALGRTARVKALPYLEDLLSSNDLQIQLTVVNAIGKNCGNEGKTLLKNMLRNSPDPLVVAEVQKFL